MLPRGPAPLTMAAMKTKFGYALSSEEHSPLTLIQNARLAEELGFEFALISDHFHPWVSEQPHSPFVWSTLGGLAVATDKLVYGTGVTCPLQRIHPALIAQAAATTAAMMEGRFFLGVGTGENLNEHILGDKWEPIDTRMAMLEEAIELIRELWKGESTTFHGGYYTVEDARIFTLPRQLPPIAVAASGEAAAELAGKKGDALVSTSPDEKVVKTFQRAGGKGKPVYGQLTVCWGRDRDEAVELAHRTWPNSAFPGQMSQEIRTVEHFDQLAKSITREQIAEKILCGPDVEEHVEGMRKFIEAGFDHVYVHQIGPDQEEFLRFYSQRVLPQLETARV